MNDTREVLLCLLVAALLAASSFAQTLDRGEVRGRVTDRSGGILPGVSLVLHNEVSGHEHSTVTGDTGDFVFPFVFPGSYTLTAELTGFSPLKVEGIRLVANQSLDLPLTLQVGGPDAEVVVTAEPNRIDTANPAVRYRVTDKELRDMPIFTGIQNRGVLDTLLLLTPGASSFSSDGKSQNGTAVSINGSPVQGVSFNFDGIDNNWLNSFSGGAATVGPNPDALEEFSVLTHTFSAASGGHPVLVHLKTKSGGNEFHGQARVIHLNPDLSARDFFDTQKKSLWTTNALGFQFSGPVILPRLYQGRNKTLFLFDVEMTRSRSGSTARDTVLSDAQRAGDFSDLPKAYQPIDPVTGQAFPDARIPANRILPQSRFYIDQFIPRATEGNERVESYTETPRGTQLTARIDHQFTPAASLNASLFFSNARWDFPLSWTQGTVWKFPDRGRNLSIQYTHSLSPRAVNSLTFGRSFSQFRWVSVGKLNGRDLTQQGYNIRRETLGPTGFPQVYLLSTNWFDPGGFEFLFDNSVWSWKDGFALTKRSHALKLGGEIRWLRGTNFNNYFAPTFQFYDGNPFGTGNEVADFLLGIPLSYSQGTDGVAYPRRLMSHVYLQDDIKLRANLTLNLGLRYELNGVWSDREGRNATFRPGARSTVFPKAPAGLLFAGDRDLLRGQTIGRGLNPPDHNNFAPRVGIAYSPWITEGFFRKLLGAPGRTSIRAGYGVYYVLSRMTAELWMDSIPPWFLIVKRDAQQLNQTGGNFANPWGRSANPFPTPLTNRDFFLPVDYLTFVEANFREPYQHQWTLSLQREFPQHVTVEAAYLGNTALHLGRQFDANPGLLTPQANPFNVQSRRAYQDFGSLQGYSSDGVSSYHALQGTVSRRFASDLQLNASYVWSKALDNNGGDGQNIWNQADRDATSWARANFDRRHQFVFYSVWNLPDFRRVKILDRILSGWQMTTLVQIRSGIPLNIRNAFDSTLRGITAASPDIVSTFQEQNPRRVQTFELPNGRTATGNFLFDPSVFRTVSPSGPGDARFGNLGRNAFTGPGANNTDLSLLRRFRLRDRHRLEIRIDVDNLFNHAQFRLPVSQRLSTNSSQLGRTFQTTGPRRLQFVLKYAF